MYAGGPREPIAKLAPAAPAAAANLKFGEGWFIALELGFGLTDSLGLGRARRSFEIAYLIIRRRTWVDSVLNMPVPVTRTAA